MQDISEIILLKKGNIKITNLRAIIGTKAYAMSNIDSVRVQVNEPKLFLPVFFMVLVAVCLGLIALADLQEFSSFLRTGLYISIAAFLLFLLSQKTKYSVRVRSSVSELDILEANDRDHIERIVRAMNEAIILRG